MLKITTRQVTVISFLLVGFSVIGVGTYFSAKNVALYNEVEAFSSVEVGVAELSPNGEEGGYAVPASGDSYTCSVTPSPQTFTEYTGNVNFTIGGTGSVNGMDLYRNGSYIGGFYASNGGFSDPGAFTLPAGRYTYSVSGSYTVSGGAAPICTAYAPDYCASYDYKSGMCYSWAPGPCISYWSNHDSTYTASCSTYVDITPMPRPDITAAITNPGTRYVSVPFAFTGSESNVGPGSVTDNHTARFNIRPQGGGIIASLDVSMGTMGPGGNLSATSPNWTPSATGAYEVQLCGDNGDSVWEVSGGNNCSGWTLFNVIPQPDLVAFTSSPSSGAYIDNPVSVTFTGNIQNNGGITRSGELISGNIEIDLNNNTCASPSADITQSAGAPGSSLAQGASQALSSIISGTTLKNGRHCYRFVADPTNVVWESNDTNNSSPWVGFIVTGLPDSTADLRTTNSIPTDGAPPFVDPSSITFAGLIRNAGLETTLPGQQIWGDVEIDWNKSGSCLSGAVAEQTFNAGGPWTELPVGGIKSATATVLATNLKNGQHCYRMIADRGNFVAESDDTNNAASPWIRFSITDLNATTTGGNPAPSGSLEAEGLDGSATIPSGSTATLTWDTDDAAECDIVSFNGGQTFSDISPVSSGSQITAALTAVATTHELYCKNNWYPMTYVDRVTVYTTGNGVGGTVSIDAEKKQAKLNEPVNLIYDTGIYADCRIEGSNDYISPLLPIGQGTVTRPTTGTVDYAIYCNSRAITDTVRVELIPGIWED